MNDTLKIKFLSGTQQGTKYSLKPPMVCTIGRSDDCSIVIKDDGNYLYFGSCRGFAWQVFW